MILLQYPGTSLYDRFNSRVFIVASVIYHSSITSRNIGRRADAAVIFAVTGLHKSTIPSEAILESWGTYQLGDDIISAMWKWRRISPKRRPSPFPGLKLRRYSTQTDTRQDDADQCESRMSSVRVDKDPHLPSLGIQELLGRLMQTLSKHGRGLQLCQPRQSRASSDLNE